MPYHFIYTREDIDDIINLQLSRAYIIGGKERNINEWQMHEGLGYFAKKAVDNYLQKRIA